MANKPKLEEAGYFNEQHKKEDNPEHTQEIIPLEGGQYTTQHTNTIMIQPPKKPEPYDQRLVANVTRTQKKYVQKMAKSFDNESAFVRYVLDLLMANGKLEGKE